MSEYPLLKYAVEAKHEEDGVVLLYRRRKHKFTFLEPARVVAALSLADGRTHIADIIRQCGLDSDVCRNFFERLHAIPLMLDGRSVLREDGYLSGCELFWRLEKLLFRWRYPESPQESRIPLEEMIATGKVPSSVVKGYCLELGYLLRQVPDELSLAVAHAPNEVIRSLFMQFYDEESRHGEILFDALQSWFDSTDEVLRATPLPATTGLLNTYRAWAMRHPLLYATALMRDESSRLDADIPPHENIYRGMRNYYDIPKVVVDKFEWHANLDRNCDHGFFPEQIFSQYPVISRSMVTLIVSALKQIIELHDLFKWNVWSFYENNSVYERLYPNDEFERDFGGKFIHY